MPERHADANDRDRLLERQRILADFGDFALQSEDLDAVLTEACRLVAEAMQTRRAKILEIEEDGRTLLVRAGTGWSAEVVGHTRIPMDETSSESYSIREGAPVISRDITTDGRFSVPPFMRDEGVAALANVPIFLPGGRPYGLLQVDDTEARDFDGDDSEFLRTYATILGPVIDRLFALRDQRSTEARYRAFVNASADQVFRLSLDFGDLRDLDERGRLVALQGTPANWLDHFAHDEDRPALREAMEAAIRTGAPFETEHRSADGTKWLLTRIVPLRDSENAIVEWMGTARDITGQKEAELHLRENEEQHALLLNLSDALRPLVDPAEIQATACRHLAEELSVDRVYYVELDHAAGRASVARDHVEPGVMSLAGMHRIADFAWSVDLLRADRHVIRDTRVSDLVPEADRQAAAALDIIACAGAPLIKGGELVGALCVTNGQPRNWTAHDLQLLREVADRTYAAILAGRADAARSRSEARLASDLAATSRLRDLGERLVTEESIGAIHEEVLDAALAILSADAGSVQLHDPGSRSLYLLTTRGFDERLTRHLARVDVDGPTACARAIRSGARVIARLDESEAGEIGRINVAAGYRSVQATPLISRSGAILGVLSTQWRAADHSPDQRDLHFIDLLARQAADLIEQRRAARALREREAQLQGFGEASSDVLWIRDAETLGWTYLSPAFERIYGMPRQSALAGDTLGNWLSLVVEEDRDLARRNLQRVLEGERVTFEYKIRRPSDGEIRWLRNTDFPIRTVAGEVAWIGGVGHDATDEIRMRDRLELLVAELQHRTKNLMGVVLSIGEQTLGTSASLPDFAVRFRRRMDALARVNTLLSRLDVGQRVTFDEVIGAEIDALDEVSLRAGKVRLDGPPGIALRSSGLQTFALALHELATNALKYGALAHPQGRLDVFWRLEEIEGRPWLRVDWHETGVPLGDEADRQRPRGAGRRLIEEGLPYQLGARTSFVLSRGGVRCSIAVPASQQGRTGTGPD